MSNKRRELLIDRGHMYALTIDDQGQVFLEVSCGGIAMQDKAIRLTQAELAEYEANGKDVLDTLALKVCRKPGFFEERQAEEANSDSSAQSPAC